MREGRGAQHGLRVEHGTDHPLTLVDGVLHTCGPLCQHRRHNNDGSYTCLLTVISYGQTMSHGSFDTNNFIDDFGDVRAVGGKRAQTAPQAPWHNLEAVAITVIHHLFVAVGPHGELVPGPRVVLERRKRA